MNRISYANQVHAERASYPGHPVILSLPSFLNPLDIPILHHGDDFTPVRENQKTYRRLFGTIFFGGSESMVISALQWFATRKFSKNRQNSKANSIFIFRNIDLAAKRPEKRPVFSVSTNLRYAFSFVRHCGRGDCIDFWKPLFRTRILRASPNASEQPAT
jgi:hypothetical protein